MQSAIDLFNEYVKQFDLKEKAIERKYEHSFRVMECAKEICLLEEFDEEETKLSLLGALFHDIGRFIQWTEYQTYEDSKSIDHGDKGLEILKDSLINKIDLNNEEQQILLKTVELHNKKYVPENMNKEIKKIVDVIRDADKIDIMNTQMNELTSNEKYILNQEIMDNFLKEELVNNEFVNNSATILVSQLGYVFDINYRASFKIIYSSEIINHKLELLKQVLSDAN